ncbi:carbohydrate ABC transporter permease [Cryptosporangium sp. NPDC048952]|uniref:carbohydrate ABC transporter permease n=1 Tax=Cryptosporangium sp. NPDC048952 TaxID=3363961 RepID=UPI00371647D4
MAGTPPAVAPTPVAAPRKRRWLPFSAWHLVLMPLSLIFVLPLVQMVLTSLMPEAQITKFPPEFIPRGIHFDGYQTLFAQSKIVRWVVNTVVVSAVSVLAHLVLCSLAGYGFARLKFPGRGLAFLGIIATVMIPIQVLMIPTYLLFARIGIVDTLAAAFVPWLASAFGIFLMRQFFLSLPVELEEAALLDGAGAFRTFTSIVLPLARPALATLAVFTLLSSWNDLLWPLIAITDDSKYTLQVGLASFQGMRRTEWSQLMAGNVIATLPLVLAFLFAQKRFIATMSFSGLKG